MKKKSIYALLLITMTMLAGCGKQETENTEIFEAVSSEASAEEPAPAEETTPETETTPEEAAESAAEAEKAAAEEAAQSGRKDGERFDGVITLEGMEETVHYEHIINESAGIEMDYDYESFVRESSADTERFISIYDDPSKPENYLEVTRSSDDAKTVADAIEKEFAEEYKVSRDDITLENGVNCIQLSASQPKNEGETVDYYKGAFIIPKEDGCIITKDYMYFEASEGFGRRFVYMINTIK